MGGGGGGEERERGGGEGIFFLSTHQEHIVKTLYAFVSSTFKDEVS